MICVYTIRHPWTGVFYHGSTTDFRRRQRAHVSHLRRGIHPNELLSYAFGLERVLGWSHVEYATIDEAKEAEKALIEKDKANPLLANVQFAKKYPAEHGEAISKARTGMKFSDEWRAKISAAGIGRRNSPEAIEKTAQAKRIAVMIDGVIYKSGTAASEELGIPANTIMRRVRNNKYPNYSFPIVEEAPA